MSALKKPFDRGGRQEIRLSSEPGTPKPRVRFFPQISCADAELYVAELRAGPINRGKIILVISHCEDHEGEHEKTCPFLTEKSLLDELKGL